MGFVDWFRVDLGMRIWVLRSFAAARRPVAATILHLGFSGLVFGEISAA